MRIISTVPSQTELLHSLGLEEEVVGITKFCVYPEKWFREKEKIGGTKNLNISKIISLKPDWIFSNKEENIREQIEALYGTGQHYTSDVTDLSSALSMIQTIGQLTGTADTASGISAAILSAFDQLSPFSSRRKALYLIWKKPYMSIGGDTFIHQMLNSCGWENVCADLDRYPEVTIDMIRHVQPDDIILSSEPYPFKEKDISELREIFPDTNIILADGTYFSWYGSRLQHSPEYFKKLIRSIENH